MANPDLINTKKVLGAKYPRKNGSAVLDSALDFPLDVPLKKSTLVHTVLDRYQDQNGNLGKDEYRKRRKDTENCIDNMFGDLNKDGLVDFLQNTRTGQTCWYIFRSAEIKSFVLKHSPKPTTTQSIAIPSPTPLWNALKWVAISCVTAALCVVVEAYVKPYL